MQKSSTNNKRHPYLRGHSFWSENAFWRNDRYSDKQQYRFEVWLDEMRVKEKQVNL
jgi:hypothetical protein